VLLAVGNQPPVSSLRTLPVLAWFVLGLACNAAWNATRVKNVRNLAALKTMLFDKGGIAEIFAHLRNLLIATVIIAAGSYAIRQAPDVEIFGVLNLEITGLGVEAIGVILVGLNLLDGLYKLTRIGSPIALKIALVGVYVFISMRLVQIVVLLRAG
jgi:hypothetical protein